VLILDHHKTALESCAETALGVFHSVQEFYDNSDYSPFTAVLDMNRSGIGIVLEWTNPPSFPSYMLHLEDRDLWRFNLPGTPEIFAAVTSRPYTTEAWDELADMSPAELIAEGAAIERYRQNLISQTLETAYPFRLPDGTDVLMVACPYAVGSDVAGELAKISPSKIGAYFVPYGRYNKYGLRSTPDGPDVAEIAARCAPGGGGHAHASGFELHLAP
jgi:oligoribonuclease NrnB/cAMP/cGMP phosphodiesterase (DHH superfamily)